MKKVGNTSEIGCLIEKVRDSDQEAFLELLERYKPLLHSQVSKFTNDELTKELYEDLLQEATIVFYNAILNFDLTQKDVEFGLYARLCIYNALVSQMRVVSRRKAEQPTELDSSAFADNAIEDLVDNIVEAENIKEIYSTIKKHLSSYEYSIWHSYMLGKTAKEIGEMLDKDEKSVSNAVYRIRKKLRAVLK